MKDERDYSAKELLELEGISEGNVCTHEKEYFGKRSDGTHNWHSCTENFHVGSCPLNSPKVEVNETEYVF